MARPIEYDPDVALDRAMELFWSQGYAGTSVQDLVRDTGLNRHSLYSNFRSKFGLLQAVLSRYEERALGRIRGILSSNGSVRERLEAMLCPPEPAEPINGAAFWYEVTTRGCLALRLSAELREDHDEIVQQITAFGEAIENLVAETCREGQANGEISRDRTPEDMASVLVGGFLLPLVYKPAARRREAFLTVLD